MSTKKKKGKANKTYKKLSPLIKKVALTPLESSNLTRSDVKVFGPSSYVMATYPGLQF